MKKFLSLALALIMTMSLVTISASADFTDDDAITYAEAVDVMYAIDVIGGYTDGSFDPEATLTRGAACKIICNMILGPTTADALGADAAPFPDVAADHVFAGYIAYCAAQGIVGGYADGNFYPAGEVTGVQFMKMLLGALGYESSKEGFTGDNWSVNVQKLALSTGLNDGNDDYVGADALTREEACLYAFNTLCADMVSYSSNFEIQVGDATISDASKADVVTSYTASNSIYDESDDNAYYVVQFAEKYFENLKLTAPGDSFGNPTHEWHLKTVKIGAYAQEGDLVATYTAKVEIGDLYNLITKSVYDKLDATATLTVVEDGAYEVDPVVDSYFYKNSSAEIGGTGTLTKVYVDDDSNVTITMVNTYLAKATADYSSTKETVSIAYKSANGLGLETTVSSDDFDVEDIAKDDYLLITGTADGMESIAVADTITGEVTTYTLDKNVTIDGVKYSYSAMTPETDGTASTYSVGEEAVLVLDTYGNAIFVDDAVVISNYAFINLVESTNNFGTTWEAEAFFTDGTYEIITLDKINSVSVTGSDTSTPTGNVTQKQWYAYSKNSDGEYNLTTVTSTAAASTYSQGYKTETATVAGELVMDNAVAAFLPDNSSSLLANNSTIVTVRDKNGDVTSYTGLSEIPEITLSTASATATMYYMIKTNATPDYATYLFVDLKGVSSNVDDGAESTDYYFTLEDKGTVYTTDYSYTNWLAMDASGEEVYITAEAGVLSQWNMYAKTSTNSDGIIDGKTLFNSGVTKLAQETLGGTTLEVSDGIMRINGTNYVITDDTVITVVSRAAALNKDKDADYEITENTNAATLNAMLDGYLVTGYAYVAKTETTGTEVDSVYVYVSAVSAVPDSYTMTIDGTAKYGVSISNATSSVVEGTSVTIGLTGTVSGNTTRYFQLCVDGVAVQELSIDKDIDSSSYSFSYTMPSADVTLSLTQFTTAQLGA